MVLKLNVKVKIHHQSAAIVFMSTKGVGNSIDITRFGMAQDFSAEGGLRFLTKRVWQWTVRVANIWLHAFISG